MVVVDMLLEIGALVVGKVGVGYVGYGVIWISVGVGVVGVVWKLLWWGAGVTGRRLHTGLVVKVCHSGISWVHQSCWVI